MQKNQRTVANPPSIRARFSPAPYFKNRAIFSKLRRNLRRVHNRMPRHYSGFNNPQMLGDIRVWVSRNHNFQTVTASKEHDIDTLFIMGKHQSWRVDVCVEHSTRLSTVGRFLKSLPKHAFVGAYLGASSYVVGSVYGKVLANIGAGGIPAAILDTTKSFFGTVGGFSIPITGAIVGIAVSAACALGASIRSVTSPAFNKQLYDAVKSGNGQILKVLKSIN